MNIRNCIAVAFTCLAGLLFTTASAQDDEGSLFDAFSGQDSDGPAAPSPSFSAPPARGGGGSVVSVPGDARTISEAMITARMGDTVYVGPGVYKERVIMAPGVALISRGLFEAKINGMGRGTVVTMSKNCTISGFEVTNGTIGIFTSDLGNEISSCRIVNNWMTGIITVRHLPKIQDNIIAFNRASGIQGWDVRSTSATVNHNSIAYNGNHGIAIGGSSEFIIENNVIAFNERFGLKILEAPEKIQVSSNNFFRNLYQPGRPLPENNFTFDPAFIAPRSGMNFKPDPGQCCKEKGSDDENLGARLTY
jgi:parallel beta-helix repeat protein